MASPNVARPASAADSRPRNSDPLPGAIDAINTLRRGRGQLLDRWGNAHSEAVFVNWTPNAIRAMGIHRRATRRRWGSVMTALSYDQLADLCDRKLGTRDVACPWCGPDRRSPTNRKRRVLRVWHRELGFATYHCERCKEQGWARDGAKGTPSPEKTQILEKLRKEADVRDHDYARRQLEKARWLWSCRQPIEGSPVEEYLRRVRHYRGALPATIGFLPARKPEHHPAMIAAFGVADEIEPGAIMLADNEVRGAHLTLLKPDGSGKAGTERDKFTPGSSTGWPIVIAPPNDLLGLAITEGIEDALSVHQATGLGAWAAGAAGRMPALARVVPNHIEAVTIYAHDDRDGQRHAKALADALLLRGIEVFGEGIS